MFNYKINTPVHLHKIRAAEFKGEAQAAQLQPNDIVLKWKKTINNPGEEKTGQRIYRDGGSCFVFVSFSQIIAWTHTDVRHKAVRSKPPLSEASTRFYPPFYSPSFPAGLIKKESCHFLIPALQQLW